MPRKKFTIHDINAPKTAKRAPPKPYIEAEWLTEYRNERDICIYIENGGECRWTAEQIEQVKQKYFNNYQTKLL